MPKRNLFVLLLMIAVAGVSWLARDRAGHGRRFAEVLGAIERSYLEPVDQQSLFDAAMEGVFSQLDEHSSFVAGVRRAQLETMLDQEFGGVGLELTLSGAARELTVLSPVVGAPAWRSGIAAGDRIRAIDGVPTNRMTLEQALNRLRGQPGTPVVLAIVAASGGTPDQDLVTADAAYGNNDPVRNVPLVREIVKIESVLGDRRRPDGSWDWAIEGEPGCVIIRIESFGERTVDELRRAIDAISDGTAQGGVILDLRGNSGGLLSAAVEVCDLFLDEGVIVSTRGRGSREADDDGEDSAPLDVRRATRGAALAGLPMAVLIDGLTASAAEVVAACLQDHRRPIVVGSRSFGKGTVQSILPLSDGSGLVKLTTSEYRRPNRTNIHRRIDDTVDAEWGVSPDLGCEITPTGRQSEAIEAWRRIRDVASVQPQTQSMAALPRHIDPVLARAIDQMHERR
ncbi:MAG: S41 family peptidase [Planctomycetes bacterium]|nr:S41 family peptidase [Planctomycetota bacterium]